MQSILRGPKEEEKETKETILKVKEKERMAEKEILPIGVITARVRRMILSSVGLEKLEKEKRKVKEKEKRARGKRERERGLGKEKEGKRKRERERGKEKEGKREREIGKGK